LLTLATLTIAGSLDQEARPFVSDGDTVRLVAHTADNSFPSEHAAGAAALAVVGMLAWPRWRAAFLAAAFAVGIARVAAGLHYPNDVIIGWTLGAVSAYLAWMCSGMFMRRVTAALDGMTPR
jgi:membrane-associated phospholipid phosphatase